MLLDHKDIRTRDSLAYHPWMLPNVPLTGYRRGVYSSRHVASACESDATFRVLSSVQFPDCCTVFDFRTEHLAAFEGLLLEVLRPC